MACKNHPIRAPSSSAGSEIATRRGHGKPKYYLGLSFGTQSFGTQTSVLRDVNPSSSGTSNPSSFGTPEIIYGGTELGEWQRSTVIPRAGGAGVDDEMLMPCAGGVGGRKSAGQG